MDIYIHNAKEKRLYIVPETPHVTERTSRGRFMGYTVTVHIKGYDFSKDTDCSYPATDWYDTRDSKERAISYFKSAKYPKGQIIDSAEYVRLTKAYEAVNR